ARLLNRPTGRYRVPPPVSSTAPRVGLRVVSLDDEGAALDAPAVRLDGLVVAGFGAGHVPRRPRRASASRRPSRPASRPNHRRPPAFWRYRAGTPSAVSSTASRRAWVVFPDPSIPISATVRNGRRSTAGLRRAECCGPTARCRKATMFCNGTGSCHADPQRDATWRLRTTR
ncbi:MAG TPA: hypothetical protein VF755_02600, partial [Catenuloplanes sp.]